MGIRMYFESKYKAPKTQRNHLFIYLFLFLFLAFIFLSLVSFFLCFLMYLYTQSINQSINRNQCIRLTADLQMA